jgi:hypothetical protein
MNKKLDKLSKLTKQNRESSFKLPSAAKLFNINRFGPLVFLLVFIGAGAAFIHNSSAQSVTVSNPDGEATMYLTPTKQNLGEGDAVIASVWVDSHDLPVNAVQAVVKYPADKLTYISSSSASSQFTVQAQATQAKGRVVIARGSTTALTGNQLVASLTFKSISNRGHATIEFDTSSLLMSSSTNKNVLGKLTGGTYQLTK